MSRAKRGRHADASTGDLFAIPRAAAQVPGTMDYRQTVSALTGVMLSEAAAAGLDRYEIASQASRLSGKDVSKLMLDGYTAESREDFNIPLWLAPVIESVCCSTRLTEWLVDMRGGRFLVGAETLDAEIGRISAKVDTATTQLKQLRELRRRIPG